MMRITHSSIPPALLAAVALSLCPSCSDDPELVEKREAQKSEIVRLKGELALIEEKLKNLPPDVSDELPAAKATAEKQAAEIVALEAEVDALENRKREIQAEFDTYRIKYQVK